MIGGLIQQQQVGATVDYERQRKSRLFTARKRCNGLERAFPMKMKTAKLIAHGLIGCPCIEPAQVFQRRGAGVKLFRLMLVKVADAQVRIALQFAVKR